MGISGRLDDVSIAEVMQFIHLGARSGVLYVEGPAKTEVHFNAGRIVAAHGSRVKRLGDLLVRQGVVRPEVLVSAIERQRQEGMTRKLGEVLLSMGAVGRRELTGVVEVHIQETIRNVLSWRRGTFRFELGEVEPIEGFERSLDELLPSVDLNTQRVLLEAARILDEAKRDGTGMDGEPEPARPPTAAPSGETVDELFGGSRDEGRAVPDAHQGLDVGIGGPARSVYILSNDDVFVGLLAARLDRESIWLERCDLDATEPIEANGHRVPILIDAGPAVSETAIEALVAKVPNARLTAIVDPTIPEEYVGTLGTEAIVERTVDAVVSHCLALVEGPAEAHEPTRSEGEHRLLRRLRRLSSEIRTGALSASATLALLNTLAECSERSVLFAVRDDVLRAIGGFGFSTLNGRPVVEVTRGLTLPLDAGDALVRSVSTLEARELDFDDDPLPDEFTNLVGPPESGSAAVFPVSGTEKVILLVYTDNGSHPVEDLDLMTLAADQVGVAIENEFLRYRLSQN